MHEADESPPAEGSTVSRRLLWLLVDVVAVAVVLWLYLAVLGRQLPLVG